MLDISINNSWILYKQKYKGQKKKSLKVFRNELYLKLTKRNRPVNVGNIVESSSIKNPKIPRPISPIRYDNVGHFPIIKEDMGRCKFCQKIQLFFV